MSGTSEISVELPNGGQVSALLTLPADPISLLVLAHGAGAGMKHAFLEALAEEMNLAGIATFRYQFPYVENGRHVPDSPAILTATVRAAVDKAVRIVPNVPVFAGGKSMGGRMTSTAASERPLEKVRGIVFFGFPLHPPKRPGTKRADHLRRVTVPMLFLQGTRDVLADLQLLRPICAQLDAPVLLREFEGADHGFHVLKSSGNTDAQIVGELATNTASWMKRII